VECGQSWIYNQRKVLQKCHRRTFEARWQSCWKLHFICQHEVDAGYCFGVRGREDVGPPVARILDPELLDHGNLRPMCNLARSAHRFEASRGQNTRYANSSIDFTVTMNRPSARRPAAGPRGPLTHAEALPIPSSRTWRPSRVLLVRFQPLIRGQNRSDVLRQP